MAVKSHKDAMNLCADGQVEQTMGCSARFWLNLRQMIEWPMLFFENVNTNECF